MGASILPVAVHNGKVYLLFGKERDNDTNPGWSDFGGGTDKGETFMDTASREGGEELTGFLGSTAQIRQLMTKNGNYVLDYQSPAPHSTYRVHITPLPYDDALIKYYNNNQRFLQQRLDKRVIRDSKLFEKVEIKWVPIGQLSKMRSQFREFYRHIVDMLVVHTPAICAFVRSKQKSKRKTGRGKSYSNQRKKTQRKKH